MYRLQLILASSLAFISMNACQRSHVQDTVNSPVRMQCVNTISAQDIRSNDKGRDLAADIILADIPRTDTTIGYGPALSPKAEITIVDGVYSLTRPDGSGTLTGHVPKPQQGATFLVHASPKQWKTAGTLGQTLDLTALSRSLGILAVQLGCTETAVFPFKITGHARALTWSVTGEPKGMKGDLENVDVTIVGVYDNSGAPRNAIMDDLQIHPHVVIASENISGHLNTVNLNAGASVFVPAKE